MKEYMRELRAILGYRPFYQCVAGVIDIMAK